MAITLNVTTTFDQNDRDTNNGLSLREAIMIANRDTNNEYIIELESGAEYTLTIATEQGDEDEYGDLDIFENAKVTIRTMGLPRSTINAVSITNGSPFFEIQQNGILNLQEVNIIDGETVYIRTLIDGNSTSSSSNSSFVKNNGGIFTSINGGNSISTNLTNLPNPQTGVELLNDQMYRFQNRNVSGTYLFAGVQESFSIRQNFRNTFVEEGEAFKVSTTPEDGLIRFNRFQNRNLPGTYLFAGEQESVSIRQNFSNTFMEEGIAFYALSADANLGTDYYRLQNTQVPGTYIFVDEQEKNNILANFPQFQLEGVAFEVA